MSSRVVDYFALVRCCATPTFTTEVQMRFPPQDHDDCSFPTELHMFCFPTGDDIFRRPETVTTEFSFLLTEIDGRRVYVSVIRFAGDQRDGSVFCLALTSHWSFYNQMLQFLRYIHSYLAASKTLSAPLESILVNLIHEVPLPPRGRTEVVVPLISANNTAKELCFKRPPPNAGVLIDYDFDALFRYFSLDNILTIFSSIFSERRIVVVASHESCLTTLMEALNCIIFPFVWRHAYIPLLPSSLVDYLCAPMPFMMGICRVYLPESSALSGAVLVDCDLNTVTFLDESGKESAIPLPDLPDRAGKQLLKRLRALTSQQETHLVCPFDVPIDFGAVKDCFLRFFATIFQNFHSCFDDSKEPCFDKKAFLDACSDRCEFVDQLLNTQMFASFLDERIQFPDDMDILLFDQCIRREQGKPAAFLADTSQIHRSRYICQSPITFANLSYDSGFPNCWNPSLIPDPRPIELLVDISTEVQRAAAAGASYDSLRFFMDQKTYSRKLNTISQHCARDDQMFLSIVKSLNEWTTLQRSAQNIENKLRPSKLNTGDEFSVADAWNQVHLYIESCQTIRQTGMKTMGSLNDDFAARVHFIDREIRILFDESKQLDAEATLRKTELERIKLLLVNARQKLAIIEAESRMPADSRKSVSLFRQSDLSRLVAARSEVQSLSIEQSEAETAFWTHLDLYNSRIPQIISELERLGFCRVAALKSSLKLLTSSRLELLRQEISSLENLSNSVNAINIDETLFQENAPDSYPVSISHREADSLRAYTPSPIPSFSARAVGLDPNDSPPVARQSQSAIDVAQLFRYSVLLWGQFDTVFRHAIQGKGIVKQLSVVVDTASSLFESVSRSMGKLSKSSAVNRSDSVARSFSSKLQNQSDRYVARLSHSENMLNDQLESIYYESSQQSLQISRKFQQLFVEIRVLKRECKGSFSMIQRRRTKLESEIQAAYETYHKNGVGGFSAFSNANLGPKSQREIDVLSRQWEAAQVQHQLGNAHLLDQFQRMEQLRLSSLKRIMTDWHSAFTEYYRHLREMQGRLLSEIEDVNIENIIVEYNSRFTDEQSNKDLFDHIGDGIAHISWLILSMESLISIDETLSNKLRKGTWNIDVEEAMPTISKALGSVSSFFQFWPNALDQDVANRREDIVELRRMRDQWQSKLSIAISKEQNEKKNRDAVFASYEKARLDVAKAMQTVSNNRERLAKTESESVQPDTGMKLMKFMKTPIDKQRIRLVESESELDAAQTSCNRLESEKRNAEQKFAETVNSLRSFAMEVEQSRLSGLFAIMNKFVQHMMQGNDTIADAIRSSATAVEAVNVQSDMSSWVDSVRENIFYECPEIVLRNLERAVENADLQTQDRKASVSAAQSAELLLVAVTDTALDATSTGISGSTSPSQFYTIEGGSTGVHTQKSLDNEDCQETDLVPGLPQIRQPSSSYISDTSSISTLSDQAEQ